MVCPLLTLGTSLVYILEAWAMNMGLIRLLIGTCHPPRMLEMVGCVRGKWKHNGATWLIPNINIQWHSYLPSLNIDNHSNLQRPQKVLLNGPLLMTLATREC
jgi:hypothetical protein